MKNRIKRFFAVLLAAFTLTGCGQPAVQENTAESSTETVTTTAEAATTAKATTTAKTTTTAPPTTKAATATTAPPAPTAETVENRLQYQKYIVSSSGKAMSDTRITIKKNSKLFEVTDVATWYLYHFNDLGITGIGADGSQFHVKGYAYIIAQIKDNRNLVVEFRSKSKDIVFTSYEFESNNDTTDILQYSVDEANIRLKADLYDACFKNGLYRIRANYTINGTANSCDLYLFVNCASDQPQDYEFYLCYAEKHFYSEDFDPMERQRYVTNLIASEGATPENTLSTSYIYPYNSTADTCDTAYWINKAHEILDKYDGLSKSEQALRLHDWITANLKYDYYKVNVTKFSRYAIDGLDTSQYVSKIYTGVCLDFSYIYAFMCREFDIPCVILSTNTHAWNAIYLNGEWIEVDLTADVSRYVYGEDVNDVKGDKLYCYKGFATYSVNGSLPDTATRFGF